MKTGAPMKTSPILREMMMIHEGVCSAVVAELDPTLGSVHATLEKFENAAFLLRLGLPSTLIPSRKHS